MMGDAKSDALAKAVVSTVVGYYVPVVGWAYTAYSAAEGQKVAKKGAQAGANHNAAMIARIRIEQLQLQKQDKIRKEIQAMQAAAPAPGPAPESRKYLYWIGGLAIAAAGVLVLTRNVPRPSSPRR